MRLEADDERILEEFGPPPPAGMMSDAEAVENFLKQFAQEVA